MAKKLFQASSVVFIALFLTLIYGFHSYSPENGSGFIWMCIVGMVVTFVISLSTAIRLRNQEVRIKKTGRPEKQQRAKFHGEIPLTNLR